MASIISAGTTSGTALNMAGDTSGVLQLATNGSTTAVTVDASQNVGIGTTSPGSKLEISSSATSATAGFTSTNTNSAGYSTLQLKNTGASGRTYTIALGGNTTANAGTFYVYDDTAAANRLNITSTGLLQFNSGYGSAATAYGCRAWVNFNGTGTVAIRASGNVTSITDNGTGDYTINFTTAMPDANYNATCMGSTDTSNAGQMPCVWTLDSNQTTSAFRVKTGKPSIPGVVVQGLADLVNINVSIFR